MSGSDMDLTIDSLSAHPDPTGGGSPQPSLGRPVDLVHLARRTLGDRAHELELQLRFRTRSDLYLKRLKDAADAEGWREAAHAVEDAARCIGAWRVARSAADTAALDEPANAASRAKRIEAMEHAIDEANGFIRTLLA